MKKLVAFIFFLIATSCFAQSPFLGEWRAQWYGIKQISQGITEEIPLGFEGSWIFTETSAIGFDPIKNVPFTRACGYDSLHLTIGGMTFIWKIKHGHMKMKDNIVHDVTIIELTDIDDGVDANIVLQLLRIDK